MLHKGHTHPHFMVVVVVGGWGATEGVLFQSQMYLIFFFLFLRGGGTKRNLNLRCKIKPLKYWFNLKQIDDACVILTLISLALKHR